MMKDKMFLILTACFILTLGIPGATGRRINYPDLNTLPQGAASLAFVFDVTGSMYDDLVQVIEGAAKILATTLARREQPLYNYVLVPFHDPEIGPVTVTSDHKLFQRQLRELYVQGGGDCPEMSVGAIKMALEESLPNSFIYVFTDARAKDYALTESVLTLIQTQQSQALSRGPDKTQVGGTRLEGLGLNDDVELNNCLFQCKNHNVVFVMTGDCGNISHPGYKAYEQIAATSSGQVFLLKKSQVNQVLNFVRVAVQSRKVNLLSSDLDLGGTRWYTLAVDSRLKEFTVSLSGNHPKIVLKNPNGDRLRQNNGLKELLDLKKALIVNVKDPVPGLWKVKVASDGPHTVRVTGLSSLDFNYGFSRRQTLNFLETERRPIRGIPTYLLLNVTDQRYPGHLTHLELMSLKGDSLVNIPLVHDQTRPHLYNVSAFIPPEEFFYLRVNGKDHKGFEFQRTTPTAISPINPDLPLVTIPPVTKGYYDKPAVITCSVESMVPFTVQWYRDTEPVGNELFFAESANVTWVVEDASSFSEDVYICNATNIAGWTRGRTYLDIKDPPPSIMQSKNVSVLPGNSAMLTCLAFSTVEFNLTWYKGARRESLHERSRFNVFTNGSVEIREVRKEDEGPYICRAENEGGSTESTIHLLVQKAPIIVFDPPTRNFQSGETVNISCRSIAYPTPTYTWRREGREIVNSDRITVDDRGQISMRDMRRSHEGEYECVGVNVAGTGSGLVNLNYIESPRITVPDRRRLVNNGDTATLICEARGIPKPTITWFKGEIEYKDLSFIEINEEGHLMILGTQDMDAGDYTCVASNYAGRATAKVKLIVGSAPVITRAPNSAGVDILKNVTLQCAAKGVPNPEITWRKNDNDLVPIGGRFTKLPGGSLHIARVQKDDEGMYTCSVENQFGLTQVSAFVTITGIVKPLIAYSNPNVATTEERDVRLSCVVLLGTPQPTITWYKMGDRVRSDGHITEEDDGTLVIRNVQVNHEGEYTCVATNVGGNATYVTNLDVQVAPSISKKGKQDVTVVQDHSVRLPCDVKGDPRPQITWTKNGVRISEQDPHYFIGEDGSLEIFSADPQDTATYSCTAINVAGVDETRITLFVQLPPRIAKDEHDYTVIVNNPVQLPCEVTGNPQPNITWKKNGVVITEDTVEEDHITFLPNGALRISNSMTEDGGMYECIASSVAGNASKVLELFVQVPPTIKNDGDSDLTVVVGQSVTLECESSGDPPPVVRWRKDLQEINFFDTNHKYMMKESGSLMVPDASVDDTARFLCIVENPAGVVTKEINLVVHDPPKISDTTPSNVTIIENHRILLPCPATGTPTPEITWYKDGIVITGNEIGVRILPEGGLQIDSPGATDTGRYECVAENVAGNNTHIVTLKVYLPPRIIDTDSDGDNSPEKIEVILNDTALLQCPVSAVPPPQITWFKNGEELTDAQLAEGGLTILNDGKQLRLRSAGVEDTGRYTCVARNLAGETEKNIDLQILVPPSIDPSIVSNYNLSVIVEHPIAIDCPANGVPPPNVVWYKDGYPIIAEIEPNIRIISGGRRLEITAAEVGDTGEYKCEAENTAGEVEQEYVLYVWVPPKIDSSNIVSTPEVVINNTIILHCPASGNPIPEISWYRDEDAITTNTSRMSLLDDSWRLKISSAQTSDTARYKCRAENIAGEAEKYFDLQVLVPPTIEEGNLDKNPRVVINRTIILNCPAVGIPTPQIKWQRDDDVIKADRYPTVQLIANGRQLRIEQAQVSDSASYRCIVSNKAGRDFVDFNLQVHIPVTIDRTDLIFDPKVIVNRSETLDCPAEGIPPPVITWTKDGQEVTGSDHHHLRVLNGGRKLEILTAKVTDTGRYECRVENEAGNDQISYDLEVWVPPAINRETSSPAEPTVIVNRTTTINCYVTGIPVPEVKWLRNGRPLESNPRFRVLSDGRQLEISNAEVSDTGSYSCIATNEAGVADADFDLDVFVPPYIDMTNVEQNPKVIKGRPITLSCPAHGIPFPNVTWFKERTEVREDGRIRFLAGNRQLQISYTQEGDTARYTCVASNVAGQAKLDIDLSIYVPPTIDEANIVDNPRVVVNRTVLLECPVAGIPPPSVKWLKNGLPLETDRMVTLLSDGRQLEISSAKVTDTARYTCIASNEAGELQRNFDVEVLVPPSISGTISKEITAIKNRTIFIDCPVEGVPPPAIMWLKDQQPLLDFPYPRMRESSKGRQLEIQDVKVTDGGRYTCMATNVAGQLETRYNVKVWVPPRIKGSREVSDLAVNVKQPIRIECQPTGVPEPVITWFKDGEEMKPREARHIRILQKGRILQIISSTVNDAARYTCSAKNDAGQEQKRFTLQVYVPPSINDSLRVERHSVILGNSLLLKCDATGNPPPNIRWIREGHALTFISNPNLQLLDKNRQLQIVNAQLIDLGSYTCEASNVAGNASKEYGVSVLVPPSIEEGPVEVAATMNTRTLLLCETLGLPDPTISWEKDGREIPNNGLRYRMHRSGSIEFSAVKVEDSGVYRCKAENEAGVADRTITLQVQVPPHLNMDGPTNKRVTVGDVVVLPCEATGVPKPRIMWNKGNRKLGNSVEYEMLESGGLRIRRAKIGDSGIYICNAENNAGNALKQVRLEVQVPPNIEDQQTEFTVVQGREVMLPCRTNGIPPPNIVWEKDGQVIPRTDLHFRIHKSGWLAIPITEIDDSGSFTCIAENDAGRASILIDLVVQVPPAIEGRTQILTATQAESTRLECKSSGFPPPKISWIHDGRTAIRQGTKYDIDESGYLTIKDLQAADRGSYVCTAVNEAGRDSKETILRVQIPPTFITVPQDQEVTANGRIELECQAEGVPTPKLTWKVNNTDYPSVASVNGRSRIVIDNAMKRDDGTYMCVAENAAGLRRSVAAVRVKVPPRVLIPPGNHAVTLEGRVILDCPVRGDPAPEITWVKNGAAVYLDNRVQQLGNGSLVIYDLANDDAGEYKCIATNDAGSSEGTAQLIVNSPPTFRIEPRPMTVSQGETVIMNCAAAGEPEPRIRWRKNRDELVSHDRITIMSNNSLRIIAAQLSDSATYRCIASNDLGSSLVPAELTVQVHGLWSMWSAWSDCGVTCGQGTRFRTRACDNPEPANGGRPCQGANKESKTCNSRQCPVDGGWGEWSSWEPCSKSCGQGERSRTRACNNPLQQYGGRPCEGQASENVICNLKPCPIEGNWGEWGSWQQCSETCGDGTQLRYRRCDSPRAQHGGRDCLGSEKDHQACRLRDCSVHGGWSGWTEWSHCTLSCGGGSRHRVRLCDRPLPSNGGRYCPGPEKQIDYCNRESCAIHGNWAEWSDWGDCTVSCGGGQRRRFRTCTNPEPSHNGRPCIGLGTETDSCNDQRCAVDGDWGPWGAWSECTRTCDSGTKQRYRVCREPLFGGQNCLGDESQIRKCGTAPCIAGQPRQAVANLIGNINDKEFGVAMVLANISRSGKGTRVKADIHDLPRDVTPYLKHLISLLSPVYWTTAAEVGKAANGFTLTRGNFRREVQVEFASGQILRMTHNARGVDENGVLQVDIVLNGEVPDLPPRAKIRVLPYTENYIQTGPGSIYAQSSRMFNIGNYSLPYAWNHTISYDPVYGHMPYLVQRLTADDLYVEFDISKDVLQYQLSATISKGRPSNRCPTGFDLDPDGPYCRDLDECSGVNSPCSHQCHNKPGSFACSCPRGLSLSSDGRNCRDIDECEFKIARCYRNQECINTIGSYRCMVKCRRGFVRTAGGRSCQDINECREKKHECDHKCLNLIGSYRCACDRGFRLHGRYKCHDINECGEQNPCDQRCQNMPGSFRCVCQAGFRLLPTGACQDVDECALSLHDCQSQQECQNTAGGYKCINTCNSGLEKAENGTCIDIDECSRGLSYCHYNQVCKNTFGGYICACPRGYRSDGPGNPCVDVNECLKRTKPCSYRCRNTLGSFHCVCPEGQQLLADRRSCVGLQFLDNGEVIEGDSKEMCKEFGACTEDNLVIECPQGHEYRNGECRDIDECKQKNRCQHRCQNTPGSYRCTCPTGYRLSPNKRSCQDIDECRELRVDCGKDKLCFNRKGDYECIDTPCPPDYRRDPTTGYCVLECTAANILCGPDTKYADILEFRTLALPNGIPAFQDLIRLIAYDQYGTHLPKTSFTIIENDKNVPFNIRIEEGRGVVFTLKPLEEKTSYRIKVRAKSYDHQRRDIQYQTTFIIFISVSAYPY